jgi:hypothetical protein
MIALKLPEMGLLILYIFKVASADIRIGLRQSSQPDLPQPAVSRSRKLILARSACFIKIQRKGGDALALRAAMLNFA